MGILLTGGWMGIEKNIVKLVSTGLSYETLAFSHRHFVTTAK